MSVAFNIAAFWVINPLVSSSGIEVIVYTRLNSNLVAGDVENTYNL